MPEPIVVQGPSKETTVKLSGPASKAEPEVQDRTVLLTPKKNGDDFTTIVAFTKNDGAKTLTILPDDTTWFVRIK